MERIPAHIAIIMDGNGRWATKRAFGRSRGHRAGVRALIEVMDEAFLLGVKVVSVYAFSTENWSRSKAEIDQIFEILKEYLRNNYQKLLDDDAKFMTMGDLSRLPPDLLFEIDRVKRLTAHCTRHVFNMGLNYGGRDELVRGYNRMLAAGVANCTEQTVSQFLDTKDLPDPDLLIRTAGEQRLSNFMLYQAAYAEIYFTDTLWPDFGGKDLRQAVAWYGTRKRTYGKV